MNQHLKTLVLRKVIDDYQNVGAAVKGTEAIAKKIPSLRLEAHELVDGERGEIASEKDALGVAIAMPFTSIVPLAATAMDDGGDAWGIADIGADALESTAGHGIKVAVLDTGIAKDHAAFAGVDPILENFTDEAPDDINGHGTHCSGTIFGQDVEKRRIGIARGVRTPLIGKVLGSGGGDSESIFKGILWARDEGARVVSLSLGIDFTGFRERLVGAGFHSLQATSVALQAYRENVRLFDQISLLFANQTVIGTPLLIAAAGNESWRPSYTIATAPPAAADDILSVAALGRDQKVAFFSNTYPDCSAPGVDILSADHRGGLKLLSGTSMATPHVAGVAILEAARLQRNGSFTARQLREAVLARAQLVPGLSPADGGRGKVVV